jgi:site-specific recombinase XerD
MAAPSVDDIGRSFERHLRAERKSPRTVKTYLEAVQLLSAFLDRDGGRTLMEARRQDIEAFLVHLHERCTPATVANRYRSTATSALELATHTQTSSGCGSGRKGV